MVHMPICTSSIALGLLCTLVLLHLSHFVRLFYCTCHIVCTFSIAVLLYCTLALLHLFYYVYLFFCTWYIWQACFIVFFCCNVHSFFCICPILSTSSFALGLFGAFVLVQLLYSTCCITLAPFRLLFCACFIMLMLCSPLLYTICSVPPLYTNNEHKARDAQGSNISQQHPDRNLCKLFRNNPSVGCETPVCICMLIGPAKDH